MQNRIFIRFCILGIVQSGLRLFEVCVYVCLYALFDIVVLFLVELVAGDMLIKFDVTVGYVFYYFRCHFGNFLPFFSLEAVVHQPFADEFLRQLALRLACLELLFISFGVEVS